MDGSEVPILLHINYFEQGQSLERACELAQTLNADGIEFRRRPAGYPGQDIAYLDELSRAMDKYPMSHISFGGPGPNLMSRNATERLKELDLAEAFFRKAAARFPLRLVNTFTGPLRNPDPKLPYIEYWHHGSAIATDEHWENAISGVKRLGMLAEELDFLISIETHGVYLHDTISAAMRLVEGVNSPRVGILWDQGNQMIFKNFPSVDEVIAAAGNKLFSVHLKNLFLAGSPFWHFTGLSSGVINIREQITKLFASGYTGPLCLESPRDGDRETFAKEDMSYVRDVLSELSTTKRTDE